MIRFVLTVLLTVAVFMFSIENFHTVPVRFFVSNPVHVRLIFEIFSSIGMGILISIFYAMARKLRQTNGSHTGEESLVEGIFDEED